MIPRPYANGQRVKPIRVEEIEWLEFRGPRDGDLHRPKGQPLHSLVSQAAQESGTGNWRVIKSEMQIWGEFKVELELVLFDLEQREQWEVAVWRDHQAKEWIMERLWSKSIGSVGRWRETRTVSVSELYALIPKKFRLWVLAVTSTGSDFIAR